MCVKVRSLNRVKQCLRRCTEHGPCDRAKPKINRKTVRRSVAALSDSAGFRQKYVAWSYCELRRLTFSPDKLTVSPQLHEWTFFVPMLETNDVLSLPCFSYHRHPAPHKLPLNSVLCDISAKKTCREGMWSWPRSWVCLVGRQIILTCLKGPLSRQSGSVKESSPLAFGWRLEIVRKSCRILPCRKFDKGNPFQFSMQEKPHKFCSSHKYNLKG